MIRIYGHHVKEIDVNPVPSFTIDQAESIAVRDFGKDVKELSIRPGQLSIKEFDNRLHLNWWVDIRDTAGTPAFWYRIDAHSGEILRKVNQQVQ